MFVAKTCFEIIKTKSGISKTQFFFLTIKRFLNDIVEFGKRRELLKNTDLFEDVEAFKKIKSEYNKYWVKERKHYIENEASLLDLVLSIDDYYEYKNKFEKEGILKPILVWLYWKYREIFGKKN